MSKDKKDNMVNIPVEASDELIDSLLEFGFLVKASDDEKSYVLTEIGHEALKKEIDKEWEKINNQK